MERRLHKRAPKRNEAHDATEKALFVSVELWSVDRTDEPFDIGGTKDGDAIGGGRA